LRLVAGGWFVLREKYCWLVADKPSEQAFSNNGDLEKLSCKLERLEDLAADTARFIRLVEQEVWEEIDKRSAKRQRRVENYVPCSAQFVLKEQAAKQ
jgi:hypothetical protein